MHRRVNVTLPEETIRLIDVSQRKATEAALSPRLSATTLALAAAPSSEGASAKARFAEPSATCSSLPIGSHSMRRHGGEARDRATPSRRGVFRRL
jgi:hypothetical protein